MSTGKYKKDSPGSAGTSQTIVRVILQGFRNHWNTKYCGWFFCWYLGYNWWLEYSYRFPVTPIQAPIPNNYSGYTSGRTTGNKNTAVGYRPGESLNPEPEPEQFIGLSPTRNPTPNTKTPIQKTPILAPYSNPNKFKHPEPD
jgi:hypothetical protein